MDPALIVAILEALKTISVTVDTLAQGNTLTQAQIDQMHADVQSAHDAWANSQAANFDGTVIVR